MVEQETMTGTDQEVKQEEPREAGVYPASPASEQGVGDCPSEVAKEVVKPQVVLQSKATIQFLNEDGTVNESKTCWRNLPTVIRTLGADFGTKKDAKVRVIVEPEAGSPSLTDEGGNNIDYILAEGTMHEALSALIEKALHPTVVFQEFQRMSGFMADRSDLKGMILTLVFGDAQAGGFGMLSTTAEVTDADITTLVDSAADQLQQMKDEMKKTHPGVSFKSDKSGLILPARLR